MKTLADLKFHGYDIEKVLIEKKDELNGSDEFSIFYKIVPSDSNFDKVNIIQGVLIEATENFPYTIEVKIRGNFTISNSKDTKAKKKNVKRKLCSNTFSICKKSRKSFKLTNRLYKSYSSSNKFCKFNRRCKG